ncbi:MAG: YbaB/EbfC family nucleoid-associated protein [Rhizobiaceae bacterium]|nr:YbaB/EbfC family nucleoid-associated protein [Rhizobiaceae bacterium]
MKDLMGMMGKVKELQSKMEDMQSELEQLEAEGMSAGGMVTVTLNGKGLMKGLTIDPSLLQQGEEEILEDLIIAAHNAAKSRSEDIAREKSAELTVGLPIPPGMKLPF